MRSRPDDAGPPEPAELPCDICGLEAGTCECPECPTCGVSGDPRCADEKHLSTPVPWQPACLRCGHVGERAKREVNGGGIEYSCGQCGEFVAVVWPQDGR